MKHSLLPNHKTYRFVYRTVTIYVIVSGVYIFFSDRIVSRLFHNLDAITAINTYKGWGFVLITGLLLLYLLSRETRKRVMVEENLKNAKEKAEEADRLKSSFLANMSHEIRTPMNAIMGFSQLLDSDQVTPDNRRKFTRTIRQRTEDLLHIINDILDISKIESGTLIISEYPGKVMDLLEEIRDFFRSRNEILTGRNITFNIKSSLDAEQNRVLADFQRLKQVLMNLVDNACKFTHKGFIEIGCFLADGSALQFYVKDTGTGISEKDQKVIFERFRQADSEAKKSRQSGTGLGLSISKGIVELMHGSIWVESKEGNGSTFYFTIPYHPMQEEQTPAISKKRNSFYWGNKTILLVEDIGYNADYIAELLSGTGVSLLVAKDGASALELFFIHSEINLILLDIRLPDMSGYELARKILSRRPEMNIIAQTAYAGIEDKQKCLDTGCKAFLTKPIHDKRLLETIDQFIKSDDKPS